MEDEDPSRAWRGSSASVASRRDSIGEAEVEDFVLVGDDEEAEGNTRYALSPMNGADGADTRHTSTTAHRDQCRARTRLSLPRRRTTRGRCNFMDLPDA